MFSTNILVEMWDSPEHTLIIPTMYKCEIADVVFTPAELLIRGCFINYVYERTFTLKNMSNVQSYFSLRPHNVCI